MEWVSGALMARYPLGVFKGADINIK
jgi:hypothetical protein